MCAFKIKFALAGIVFNPFVCWGRGCFPPSAQKIAHSAETAQAVNLNLDDFPYLCTFMHLKLRN